MRANPVLLDRRGPAACLSISPTPDAQNVPVAETKDVVLAFCHNGTVATAFMQACFQAINYDSLHNRRILTMSAVQSAYIASSRSLICERFLKEPDLRWLWFVDNDVIFPSDALDRLLAVADPKDKAIVGGSYPNIFDDGIHSTWLTVAAEDQSLHPIHEIPETGMIKVASVGMGCTIIHRNVLEAIGKEYADDPWPFFGHDVITNGNENGRLGEDVTFCMRAKGVGFSTYGLADLSLDHLKYRPLAWEN